MADMLRTALEDLLGHPIPSHEIADKAAFEVADLSARIARTDREIEAALNSAGGTDPFHWMVARQLAAEGYQVIRPPGPMQKVHRD